MQCYIRDVCLSACNYQMRDYSPWGPCAASSFAIKACTYPATNPSDIESALCLYSKHFGGGICQTVAFWISNSIDCADRNPLKTALITKDV